MKKVSLKIPKGTKCKNGICEQDIELDTEIEIPEVKPFLQVQPTPELNFESENQPNAAQSTSRGTTAAEKIEGPINNRIREYILPWQWRLIVPVLKRTPRWIITKFSK